jgi:hypothetical protein
VCEPNGKKRRQFRVFGSFTSDLLGLADWLREQGIYSIQPANPRLGAAFSATG